MLLSIRCYKKVLLITHYFYYNYQKKCNILQLFYFLQIFVIIHFFCNLSIGFFTDMSSYFFNETTPRLKP